MTTIPQVPPELGTSIFSTMSALAASTGALNLGQGFPDGSGPPEMLAAAAEAIAAGHNQYAPSSGLPKLREAIAQQRAIRYGTSYDSQSEVVVTAGATEAITAAVMALCAPGDEVVVFEPYYDTYAAAIWMARATRRAVPLRFGDGRFRFDAGELAAALCERTKVLILNTPHNPTGTVFTEPELREIARLCAERDVIIVSDEVYEYLTFDDARHLPMAAVAPDRTISVSGIGKSFSATGWRIGWACGPVQLMSVVASVKQFLSFTGNTPLQFGAITALTECLEWVEQLRRSLAWRRDLLSTRLTDGGITVYPTFGSYFLQMDARSLGTDDGMALCQRLPEAAGVVAVPSVAFFDHKDLGRHLVRLAFCKDEKTLTEAADRLVRFKKSSTNG